MARPVISVITATYNCAATVEDCLRSIQGQSHAAREHIVIDGASRDGTVDVLNRNRAHLSLMVSEPDRGIYDALNKGIARATGDVLGFLHADDLYAGDDVLARVAEAFGDPSVDAVFGDLVYVDKTNTESVIRYWQAGEFAQRKLRQGWMPPHPTLYLRRELYDHHGGFDTSFKIAADYDFMLRVLKSVGGRVVYLPHVLVRMRVGGASNRSIANIVRKSAEDLRALRNNGIGGVRTLALKNGSKVTQFLRRPK